MNSRTARVDPFGADAQPGRTPERVASEITKALLRREYLVGQRLVEADLTVRLGVSRSTIREALKILASRGVVEIVPYRGAEIRRLSLEDARHLLEVLEVLTGLAARLAAARISVGRNKSRLLAAAKPLIADLSNDKSLESILDQRAHFYQVMLEVADNDDLNRAMPTWRAHLFRTQFHWVMTPRDVKAMVSEYRQLVQAIEAGDATRAEHHARRHIRKTAERTLPHLR